MTSDRFDLAIADACDRATDSVNTLAHLLDRNTAQTGEAEVG